MIWYFAEQLFNALEGFVPDNMSEMLFNNMFNNVKACSICKPFYPNSIISRSEKYDTKTAMMEKYCISVDM